MKDSMVDYCPGCRDSISDSNQRYCGGCGEPLNIEVDRDVIRRQTSGFLDSDTVSRIADSVTDERGPHHEYTHVRVEEQVRHALFDFWLLQKWADFDSRRALVADMGRSGVEMDQNEELLHVSRITGSFQFLMQSVNMEFISKMIFIKLRAELSSDEEMDKSDFDELDTVSIKLTIDDDSVDETFTEKYEWKPS